MTFHSRATSRAQRAFALLVLARAQRLLLDGYSVGLDPVMALALWEVAEETTNE